MGKKKKIVLGSMAAFAFAIVLGCAGYLNTYYKADTDAVAAFKVENEAVRDELEDGSVAYIPEDVTKGVIFYQGAKVEHTAYEPLMKALASEGILCVLTEMPFRIAMFDMNAADGIQEQYPNITEWYMGGHSLGGSIAAMYLGEHHADYKGLILLGSYSTEDLSNTSLKVLSVYGSEDKVINYENYLESKGNLPDEFTEVIIDGGCHAYFGVYGAQDGDGTPTISNEEQIALTVDAVMEFVE